MMMMMMMTMIMMIMMMDEYYDVCLGIPMNQPFNNLISHQMFHLFMGLVVTSLPLSLLRFLVQAVRSEQKAGGDVA